MKVVVTGAGGQLGLDLLDAFGDHDVVGLTHADLDVADEPAVVAALTDIQPRLVLHAGAWTDVDGCEQDPDRAHRVNALGSWWVARACDLVGAAMVLYSTDYVFSGTGTEPYAEFDRIAPLNRYGASKAAAERLVREALGEHYIVRTSWVCGARGHNFVRTMLRVGREKGEARVVDDQVGSPTFTRDLAAATRELAVTGRYGAYHRTNSGTCSWFELAQATFELSGLAVDLGRMGSGELDRPAPRPAYSVLSDRHSVLSGLREMPHWRDGLERLLRELEAAEVGVGDR
ncbi:MAG: dTDP-4-dehydrorhamnose reductase [Nitriliruptorales bacterium]